MKKFLGGFMRRLFKMSLFVLLFVSLGLFNIGGCGGGGGGGGGNGGFCNMPGLTNDFSDRAYFFVDFLRAADIGVTSDGELAAISLSPFSSSDILVLVADVISQNDCLITGITDGNIILPATGTCERRVNGEEFRIDNLSAVGVDFSLLQGFCDEVIPFDTASLNEVTSRRSDLLEDDSESELTEKFNIILDAFDAQKEQ